MRLKYLIILFCFLIFKSFAQSDYKYWNEEKKVLNDLFLFFNDTNYYYKYNLLHYDAIDINGYLSILEFESAKNINWGSKFIFQYKVDYYPFDLYNKILETGGQKKKLDNLQKRFNHFRDSINKCVDPRELLINIDNQLEEIEYKIENEYLFFTMEDYSKCDFKIDRFNKFLKQLPEKKIAVRKFNFDSINHGLYRFREFTFEPFDSTFNYKKEKYVRSIKLSRIIFDKEFKIGFFHYSSRNRELPHDNSHGAYYLILKKKGKWKIKRQYCYWNE